jgi:hypothetical protein
VLLVLASIAPIAIGALLPPAVGAQELNYRDLAGDTARTNTGYLACFLERPGQVQRYAVVCDGATRLDVSVADCCVPGDHWQAKVKSWDALPNTAVTTSPGGRDRPGILARVYNYGGPAQNPFQLRATIECTYLHGTNLFPAEGTLLVRPNAGACTFEDAGVEDEIGRTP